MTKTFFHKLSVAQKLCLSFMLVIFIGSLLLSLPMMHYEHAPKTNYLDHLFTVVSMVCVTGLSVFPIANVYNGFGQTVSLVLIQIGGLGLVTLIALSFFTINRKLSLSDQTTLQNSLSRDSSRHLKDYLFSVYKFTILVELLCAGLLMIDFIPRFGLANGIFNAIFLAISAFCNAGFDNLGASSLIDYKLNPIVNFTLAFLIIAGGLGFANWIDIVHRLKEFIHQKPKSLKLILKKVKIQTRLILMTTAIILIFGTGLMWLLEGNNPNTLAGLTPFHQFMISFFQSVTMRTAGFATIDYTQAEPATNFLFMIQMIMGGAPGGTAGGIKLASIALIFLLFKAELQGNGQVTFAQRSIGINTIKQVLTILIFFFSVYIFGYFLLLIAEPNLSPFSLLFETTSALATSGVSMSLTPELGTLGRIIIMLLMFIGRVGPITVLLSLRQKTQQTIQYATTNISLG